MILIIDENLPPRWSDFLAPFGIKAVHWRDIGTIGAPDEAIFDYACHHDAIIVTQDLDFTRILALRGSRLPRMVVLPQRSARRAKNGKIASCGFIRLFAAEISHFFILRLVVLRLLSPAKPASP